MMWPIVIGKYDVDTKDISPTPKYVGGRRDGVCKNNEMLLNVTDTPVKHMSL